MVNWVRIEYPTMMQSLIDLSVNEIGLGANLIPPPKILALGLA